MKERIKVKKTFPSYFYLYWAGFYSIEEAKSNIEGSFYKYLIAMSFSAFCLEAYLNHLGMEKCECWDSLEKLSPYKKIKEIANVIGLKLNKKDRPFKTFGKIFYFRKLIVHSKTEYLEEETEQELADIKRFKGPKSSWQKMVKLENARIFFEDTEDIIKTLHKKAGLTDNPLAKISSFELKTF